MLFDSRQTTHFWQSVHALLPPPLNACLASEDPSQATVVINCKRTAQTQLWRLWACQRNLVFLLVGGALVVSAAQSAFDSQLVSYLVEHLPEFYAAVTLRYRCNPYP